jgi:hypothetical protein
VGDLSDTIPKACRRRTRVITQDQPFMSAVGALDGQLKANQEKAGRGRNGCGVVNQHVQTVPKTRSPYGACAVPLEGWPQPKKRNQVSRFSVNVCSSSGRPTGMTTPAAPKRDDRGTLSIVAVSPCVVSDCNCALTFYWILAKEKHPPPLGLLVAAPAPPCP